MPATPTPSDGGAYFWREDGGPLLDLGAAAAELGRRDSVLGTLIDQVGPPGLKPPARLTPFQYLLRAIVYQQLSGAAARTIFGRVCGMYGPRPHPSPQALLATPVPRLKSAGLSSAKTLAALDLARFATRGRIPSAARLRRMEVDRIVERLTEVRGIGRWTVEMLLIFYLGHPDILPIGDLGIQKGFARLCRRRTLPDPTAIARRGERWRPYRSVASWYLWRAAELPRPRSRRDSR